MLKFHYLFLLASFLFCHLSFAGTQSAKTEVTTSSTIQDSGVTHKIEPGQSLSYLADKYVVYMKDIKALNNMPSDAVRVGQVIKIPKSHKQDVKTEAKTAPKPTESVKPLKAIEEIKKEPTTLEVKPQKTEEKSNIAKKPSKSSQKDRDAFIWPSNNHEYVKQDKGLVFMAKDASYDIFSSRDGVVLYVGDGIESLKQLVIVRHGTEYTSLYGNLVAVHQDIVQGATIRAGEKIGVIGDTKGLYFAIRKNGSFVEPISYLPKETTYND